jgi:cobalt transporter subunit CbtA
MPLKAAPFRAVLMPALASGIAAGVLAAVLHQLLLVPMILQAEALELGGGQLVHHDLARALYTTLFDCLAAFGFALLLAAAFTWRPPSSWKHGLAWGLAGYASFSLAPALGLPPELPGTQSAALAVREIWWVACALSTAIGLASCVFASDRRVRWFGLALIVLPHVIGAPVSEEVGAPPDYLGRNFAIGSLAVSFIMWSVIGVVTEVLMRRNAQGARAGTSASNAGV